MGFYKIRIKTGHLTQENLEEDMEFAGCLGEVCKKAADGYRLLDGLVVKAVLTDIEDPTYEVFPYNLSNEQDNYKFERAYFLFENLFNDS